MVIVIDNMNNIFFIDDVFILVKYMKIFSIIYILIIPFVLLRVHSLRLCGKKITTKDTKDITKDKIFNFFLRNLIYSYDWTYV